MVPVFILVLLGGKRLYGMKLYEEMEKQGKTFLGT